VIKKFRNNPQFVLPDRSCITMTVPFMDAYVKLLIKTCHKRGVHAMGGMAAQIPIKDDEKANKKAMEGVYADKLREVRAGHESDPDFLPSPPSHAPTNHPKAELGLPTPPSPSSHPTSSTSTCPHLTRSLSAARKSRSPVWTC